MTQRGVFAQARIDQAEQSIAAFPFGAPDGPLAAKSASELLGHMRATERSGTGPYSSRDRPRGTELGMSPVVGRCKHGAAYQARDRYPLGFRCLADAAFLIRVHSRGEHGLPLALF
jgi:hypothetical protein